MEIILISTTLDGLNESKAKTSSQVFELDFAMALSKKFKVSIISLNSLVTEEKNNVLFLSGNKVSKDISNISLLIKQNGLFTKKDKFIIFFGYDYLSIKRLRKICNKMDAYLISYTFDTHKAAFEHKSRIKRILIDLYFTLGMKSLRKVDGIILLNNTAYREMKLKIPHHISKIGIDKDTISKKPYFVNTEKVFNIVYAGSLENYNGLKIMIDSFKKLCFQNISLTIYGDGNLREYVINESEKDIRIKYKGLVNRGELDNEIAQANLLLNLRDTDHIVNKYAFPSKLIQYMAIGVPVLSTRVVDKDGFEDSAFVIDQLNINEVKKMVKYIINNPNEQVEKSNNAKIFIEENFNWDEVILDLEAFFKKLNKIIY